MHCFVFLIKSCNFCSLLCQIYQGVPDLAPLPDHAHHLITLVLEVDIAQGKFLPSVFILLSTDACNHGFKLNFPGPFLLLQDGVMITLFPLEGKQSTLDHLEALLGSEMVIISAGHTLHLMTMVLIRTKAMAILSEFIYFLFGSFT